MEGIMKLKNMSKEELELMSYTDLTEMLIKENKKPMNTPTVFHKICDLLGYSEDEYASKIGDYYTSLTIDKRFVLLDNNEWDLRDHHSIDLSLEEQIALVYNFSFVTQFINALSCITCCHIR